MKILLVSLFALIILGGSVTPLLAESGSYVKNVKFIQYLDENTALEEVRQGNLDLYYSRIPSDRIENTKSREGLKIFESTGGSYSILVNPSVSEEFNPFSIRDVRFALNYLVDRKLIVNELMGGYGTTMISNYGPYDPDYLSILETVESYHFRYNPALANEIISKSLKDAGATKNENIWSMNGKPIQITIFIRSDDPVRKSIGEIIASELTNIGFTVKKDFGDLNKAFVVVYGSNPSDLKWNLYTEGWAGRSAFVKYDSVGLGQMYSPWFSNMPGFNNPAYWNYKNEYIDSLTQRIYTGNFSSSGERAQLIQNSTVEGINESVRIFLASKFDQYVVNQNVEGVINDFGAGVPSRFTPINARTDSDSLVIGVKQIYQGSWNPVMGLSDAYSKNIWDVVTDPAIFKHPYTGETIPIRTGWHVDSAGPDGVLAVPPDAIIWNPSTQSWEQIGKNKTAISKVTFDLEFSNWHNGQKMDMNDILYSLYFTLEWGTQTGEGDKTFDTEFTPRAAQSVSTFVAVMPIDENTIDVYVNYWHFDEAEIADWASLWSSMPWEIFSAMEQAVLDGKISFSRSGAVAKNVNWLSLLVPQDSKLIQSYLESFKKTQHVPSSLEKFIVGKSDVVSRYDASVNWIAKYNHGVISNGPFYVENYSPESRTISIKSFDDDTYPFPKGHWSEFESVKFPKITSIKAPDVVQKGSAFTADIKTADSTKIIYFFSNSNGKIIASGEENVSNQLTTITVSEEQSNLFELGANDLKVFAISDSVLRPDIYTDSFIVLETLQDLPTITPELSDQKIIAPDNYLVYIVVILIAAVSLFVIVRKKRVNLGLFSNNK
jgi:peptide/nickel transport system substrate-binding protein